MGVRQAKAMGNTVTVISSSPGKEAVSKELGADVFVVSSNLESMKAANMSCDIILNTVSVHHDLDQYLPLLVGVSAASHQTPQARHGTIVQLGARASLDSHSPHQMFLMLRKLRITGSIIGGISETQECIDFCHKHGIIPNIKVVTSDALLDIYKRLKDKNDSAVRYVLDIEASF